MSTNPAPVQRLVGRMYSASTNRVIAAESLERWAAQMDDMISSGVFGAHKPSGCVYCRAQRLMTDMDELRTLVAADNPPNTVMSGSEAASKPPKDR